LRIALVRSTTFFIDGVQKESGSISTRTGTLANADGFEIGRSRDQVSYANGLIDEVKIYNYLRTPAQIAWEYNQGGPIAWWKLDECSGTVANDSSGNLYKGFIYPGDTAGGGLNNYVGSCDSGNTEDMWYNGRNGKYNASLDFDGNNDYVCTDTNSDTTCDDVDALDMRTNDWTVAAWVKTTSTGQVVSKDNNGTTYMWYLNINSSGQCSVRIIGTGSDSRIATSTSTTFFDGNWHHCAATITRSGSMQTYVDGRVDGTPVSISDISTQDFNDSVAVYLGRRVAGGYFNGQIDDARIYNYALTAQQMKSVFNEGAVRFGPNEGSP